MKKLWSQLKRADRQAYLIAGCFMLGLGIVITLICAQYYGWLQSTIRAESSGYLQELSIKTGGNVQKTVGDHFSMLSTLELLLQNAEDLAPEVLAAMVKEQKSEWGYRDLMLIDGEGYLYNEKGEAMPQVQGDYLRQTVIGRQRVISPAQPINGEDCVFFTIPVDRITLGGKQILALGATYPLAAFDQVLATTAFDGQAYTVVINRDGTLAVPSSSPHAVSFGYNVISYLKETDPTRADALETMRTDIQAGRSGYVELRLSGEANYLTYHPISTLDWCLLSVVPVAVANAKTQQLMSLTILFCVFIVVLVAVLVLLLTFTFFRHKRKLERIAFVDPITGGDTQQRFSLLAGEQLKKYPTLPRALVYTNLEKFRLVNEQYSRETGDQLLRCIDQVVRETLRPGELVCHIVDDHFCLLLECENQPILFQRLETWYNSINQSVREVVSSTLELPVSQFGIYIISTPSMPMTAMVDRARFAMGKLEKLSVGRLRYAVYDETAHQRLLREKQLEDRMERALEEGEFVVFLQPKYTVSTEQVGGAEALVRWKSREEGMIFPDEFIPLFEKNGFIIQLDLCVFEAVCQTIRRWLDNGITPVRVSVNCSRVHFNRTDFLQSYEDIFLRYRIPAEYLELELTESVVYENMERLSQVIDQIHALGFTCSIDDFGSGYSSLNMIQDVSADTLKLDKIFFRNKAGDPLRSQSVVESIVGMAKALNMQTVAEGVELRDQVGMLRRIGCDYIQGYVFAKPMPIPEFEALAFPPHQETP